jgi:cardiolipin synthase A/B
LSDYVPHFTVLAVLHTLLVMFVVVQILLHKKEATAAMAWCLLVLTMPVLGPLMYWMFGINHIEIPLRLKREHRNQFRLKLPSRPADGEFGDSLAQIALAVDAFPVSQGNAVTFYHDTTEAFHALLDAIRAAQHHVHLQYFIVRSDATSQLLFQTLIDKAKQGIKVRFVYDAWGGWHLKPQLARPLREAGGSISRFLPLNPLRSRIQVNLRNHRKLTVVDGRVGFTGGMNIGDEYLGRSEKFGYWRDTFVRLTGPAVGDMQHIFLEDWDFAARETVSGPDYYPNLPVCGDASVQMVASGPDQRINSIRELYFAAILNARKHVWIASPYFIPDSGLLDALRLARFRGVEVRLLCLLKPDHFLSFYASRYYWQEMLDFGVEIYQYARGMMHSKLMLIDGRWGMVGSANLDNRSLHLNFEIGCIQHSPAQVAELEAAYRRDLDVSLPLDPAAFARRSLRARLAETTCRLLSPIL